MWEQSASVDIDAPPALVWDVLTDLESYPDWNRYASQAIGELEVGGEVKIEVPQWRGKRSWINNVVTDIVDEERLCWRSTSWFDFLVTGTRCRLLEPLPGGGTRFSEVEEMSGPLAGLVKRGMGEQLLGGLQDECDSVRDEALRRLG